MSVCYFLSSLGVCPNGQWPFMGSDQANDLKSCDNSKKSVPKLGLEVHFQPQNRLLRSKASELSAGLRLGCEKAGRPLVNQ